jgi:hypothetical protein
MPKYTPFLDHCIFCPNTDLSETHIWPAWLNKLLRPSDRHLQQTENPHVPSIQGSKLKLGSVFRKRPYLACVSCNTGWMHKFEDAMLLFAPPIFTSLDSKVSFDRTQQRVFAVWISLITVLAEFTDHRNSVCISEGERDFLKTRLLPPENWTIVACTQDSPEWYAKYRHHSFFLGDFTSQAEYFGALASGRPNNGQFSSFGMGKLFVQVFSCPNLRQIEAYRIAARGAGLQQIWPIPGRFWPLTKRFAKFPTQTILNDQQANIMADAFNERLKRMTQPPYWGGQDIRPL